METEAHVHAGARRSSAVAAAVAVSYLLLAQYVMWLDEPSNAGAVFWPAAGVSLAALLLIPTRHWWMVCLAVFTAELGSDLLLGYSTAASTCWALANALEPLLGAALVRRWSSPDGRLVPVRRLAVLVLCAAVVAPAAAATLGATGAVLERGAPWASVWLTWTVGDGLGVLAMAPPVLAWRHRRTTARSNPERLGVVAAVLVVAALTTRQWPAGWDVLLPYLTLPAIGWAALRFGVRGAALAGLVTTNATNMAAVLELGPFAGPGGGWDATLLQVSLAVTLGTGLVVAALASDLTERQDVERLLGHQAAHDHLTGLPNRVQLHEHLRAVLRRAAPDRSVAVLFLDLDRFKVVNDSLGHGWGDALLVETAVRLQTAARPSDLVVRLGGDEFVVVCADLPDTAEARTVARRMLAAVCEPVTHDGRTLTVSTSIGIATVTGHGMQPEDVLRDADTAMYRAKRAGRNCVEVFDEELHAQALQRLELEIGLRRALEAGELRLHYQPVLRGSDLSMTAVEALLRWQHPVRGLLLPADFLAVAEDAGLLGPIGDWVVRQALQDLASSTTPELCLALDVSATQLRAPAGEDFAERVLATCRELGVDPRRLCVELTETAVLEADTGADALLRLHAAGVRLALDDFGTGQASLTQLERLPFDLVKVDRAFVAAGAQPGGERRLAAMVQLVHSFDMLAVAEGVETAAEQAAARRAGCDLLQGYHLGAPAPWADAVAPPLLTSATG